MVVHYLTISRVTDVWTDCSERRGQVRMFPLLVSSLLSAADALFNIHLGKIRRLPRLNLALGGPGPQPPAPACSLRRRGSAGTHPGLSISQPQQLQQLQAPGAGEGANQSLRGSVLLSPRAHLKSASQRGRVVPSLRLPCSYPLFAH